MKRLPSNFHTEIRRSVAWSNYKVIGEFENNEGKLPLSSVLVAACTQKGWNTMAYCSSGNNPLQQAKWSAPPNQSLKLTEPAVRFSLRAKKFLKARRRCRRIVYMELAARCAA